MSLEFLFCECNKFFQPQVAAKALQANTFVIFNFVTCTSCDFSEGSLKNYHNISTKSIPFLSRSLLCCFLFCFFGWHPAFPFLFFTVSIAKIL